MARPYLLVFFSLYTPLLLLPRKAKAEFNFQTFKNTNSSDFIFLDSTREKQDIKENPLFSSIIYHYFHNPLAFDQGEDGQGSLVSGLQNLNISSEYQLWNKASLGLELPLHQLEYRQRGSTFAIGDMRLFSKINLFENAFDREIKISTVPSIYAPTGNKGLLLSNPRGGYGINFVAEKKFSENKLALNLGVDGFPEAKFSNINYDFQSYAGVGIKHQFSKKSSAQLEWLGKEIHGVKTGDLYWGWQQQLPKEHTVSLGFSLASTQFDQNNFVYRLLLAVQWSPSSTRIITERVHTETVQKIKTVYDCGPKPYVQRFYGRTLSEEEKSYFKSTNLLPYTSTHSRPVQTLRLGGANGVTDKGTRYIKDAQVLFAIDLNDLPHPQSVISVETIDLHLSVIKYWQTLASKSDMICLLNEKICSGDFLEQNTMRENINTVFFQGKETPNDYFMRQISENGSPMKETSSLSKADLKLPFKKILENTTFKDTTDLIYPDLAEFHRQKNKTLFFSVSKDLFVKNSPYLNVEMSVQVCTEATPKPIIETIEKEESKTTKEIFNE